MHVPEPEAIRDASPSMPSAVEPDGEPAAVVEAGAALDALLAASSSGSEGAQPDEQACPAELDDEDAAWADRRAYQRKTLWANKLMRATLEDSTGHPEEVYLYLVDVSDGGMRIHLDRSLPEGIETTLRFKLGVRNFAARVAPMWQRCLPGDTWVIGLAFRDEERVNVEAARQLTDYFSPQGRRQRFKLSDALVVSLRREPSETWHNLNTLDLSLTGLKARWDGELEDNEIVYLKLFLRAYRQVEVRAQLMWQKRVGDERFEVGMRFLELTPEASAALQGYIDESVGLKEPPKRSLI